LQAGPAYNPTNGTAICIRVIAWRSGFVTHTEGEIGLPFVAPKVVGSVVIQGNLMNARLISIVSILPGRIPRHRKSKVKANMIAKLLLMSLGCVSLGCSALAQQSVVVARDGKSAFSIIYAQNAPSSVKMAAAELQHYIEKSTKAKLPLLSTDAVPATPYISVGDTPAARAQALSAYGIPLEGFRILTRNGNIFILGPDTADGQQTPQRGVSNGTANGVYTFLEKYFNVRWLLPGEMGEDVPSLAAVAVPGVDSIEAPAFLSRRLPGIQDSKPTVEDWQRHQKLGGSLIVKHGHVWQSIVPASMYAEHPEWFAEIGGKRVPPVGDRYKIETTNPQVIQHFAQTILKGMDEQTDRFTLSISATDSANWSESAASKALYDRDPAGRLSVTPLMLKFYNDVAREVGKKRTDRMVAGYIYEDHLYPPSNGMPDIEPNLFLVLATSISYGYQLYRPSVQNEWDGLMAAWSAKTSNIGYYDLPNTISGGIITPPAPEILNFIFPRAAKYKAKHLYLSGTSAWGQGAVKNYVMARMMWNPDLDANVLTHEFYQRAYGTAAGQKVEQLYQLMDAAIKEYYNKNQTIAYSASPDYVRQVMAVKYPSVEKLFLEAEQVAATSTPQQKARLGLLGEHIAVMQWQLRSYGLLPDPNNSPLYRTDTQLEAMFNGEKPGFGIVNSPGVTISKSEKQFAPVKVELLPRLAHARPVVGKTITFSTLQANRILFFPTQDNEIQIDPVKVATNVNIVRYGIYDAFGKRIKAGAMNPGEIIRFTTSAKQVYYLDIENTTASFEMEIRGAPYAIYTNQDPGKRGLRFRYKTTPIYFFVPAELSAISFTVSTASPRETSMIDLYSPSGKLVQTLDTQTTTGVRFTIPREAAPGDWEGFWCIDAHKAPVGEIGIVNIKFDDATANWVFTDSDQPLKITPLIEDAKTP
jgi:hypothetical protein